MTPKRRQSLLLLGLVLCVPVTGALAFFLAGAVVFPIVEPYYATRVWVSLGSMAIVYGFESLFSLGQITTCGFLSGNCTEHNVYSHAIELWMWLAAAGFVALIALLVREQKRRNRP
jgi:hypothetical protein